MRSIYDNVKVAQSLNPQSVTGSSAVNGTGVDTKGFNTAMLSAFAGISSSNPSVANMAFKLQESSDNSTFTDALDNTGTVIGGTVSVLTVIGTVLARVEGLGVNRKRYLRVVVTPSYTGGTTPASILDGQIVLGRAFTNPVNTPVSNT